VEEGAQFLTQCLRWARAHWRGNFTVMMNESYWRSRKYWWGCYVVYFGQFQTPALLVDGGLFYVLTCMMAAYPEYSTTAYIIFAAWVLFTKNLKLIPHLCRYPQDLVFIPVSVAFSYFHGLISLYALCTLTTTAWGSQELEMLEQPRAENEEVVPLLRCAMYEGDTYREPTPGKIVDVCRFWPVTDIHRAAHGWARLFLGDNCCSFGAGGRLRDSITTRMGVIWPFAISPSVLHYLISCIGGVSG